MSLVPDVLACAASKKIVAIELPLVQGSQAFLPAALANGGSAELQTVQLMQAGKQVHPLVKPKGSCKEGGVY